MEDRIRELERMVGRLTMENEPAQWRAVRLTVRKAQDSQTRRSGSSLPKAGEKLSDEDAGS